jgi:ComF family protein
VIHIWQQCLDFLFPPSESMLVLRAFSDTPLLSFYQPTFPDSVSALSHYSDPFIKASITAGKFEHNEAALKRLGDLLHHHLTNTATHWQPIDTIFVPIPLHPERQQKRGYNQVEVLLQAGLRKTNFRTYRLLERTKNTSPQSHLARVDRLTHLEDAFVYHREKIDWTAIRHLVLVDDVFTTGSTLEAGSAALRPHIPKQVVIELLAFAH